MIKTIKLALIITMAGLLQVQIVRAQDEFDQVRKNIVNNLKQQVSFSTQTLMPQSFNYKQLKITVDQPCLVMVKKTNTNTPEIWLADPSQKLTELNLTVEAGSKPLSKRLILPDGESKGRSIQVF